MTKRGKNKSQPGSVDINKRSEYLKSVGIPAENILDLKKIVKEKKGEFFAQGENKVLREKKWLQFLKLFSAPNWSKLWQKIKPTTRSKTKPAGFFLIKKSKIPKKSTIERQKIKDHNFGQKNILVYKIYKPLLAFAAVALIIIIPFYTLAFYQEATAIKGKVLGISTEAYGHLEAAKQDAQEFDFYRADEQFELATDSFIKAEVELNKINTAAVMIAKIIPGGTALSSAKNLLAAGKHVAKSGQYMTQAIKPIMDLDISQIQPGVKKQNANFTDTLAVSQKSLTPALQEISEANKYLQKVRVDDLPGDKQPEIKHVQQLLPTIEKKFSQSLVIFDSLLEILGHNSPKRYLLLFQNNAEMRPTGGFIGSFALIDINNGQVENIEIPGGGSYDVAGWQKAKVVSPPPLHLVNPHWNFQDANWWPDFPTSAEKTIWFYEKSGGPSVDGVISLTPEVIIRLLEFTGPINMTTDYGVVIDQDNFLDFVQAESEKKPDQTTRPKQFIADLAPILLNKITQIEPAEYLKIFSVLNQVLKERQILIYFRDPKIQEKVAALDWSGEIKNVPGDYLSVVNTNIGGGKTDIVIDQIINHQVEIQADGTIIDTVVINRVHKGSTDEIYRGQTNVDYLRIYVPDGSKLLEAKGFSNPDRSRVKDPEAGYQLDDDFVRISGKTIVDENTGTRINNEFGKTVFGNWVETKSGESSEVVLKYKLPFKLSINSLWSKSDKYQLYVQKQAGDQQSYLKSEVIYPPAWLVNWRYPDDLDISEKSIIFNTTLQVDKYIGVVFKE